MNDTAGEFAVEVPFTVGARLAEARKAQSLELTDIAARTRVPLRHLQAIEANNLTELPAIPYSVGFVRSVAQLLGLDATALAREFREEMTGGKAERVVPEPFEPADPARVPSRFLVSVAVILALVLAGGYGIWRSGVFDGSDDSVTVASDTAVPAPAPTRPAVAAPAPLPSAGIVVLTALEPVWLRVSDAGGVRLIEKQMLVGETWQVPATATEPKILTGRPQALRVTVGNTVIPPLGAPERTIRDVSLKAESLLGRLAPPATPGAAMAPVVQPNP